MPRLLAAWLLKNDGSLPAAVADAGALDRLSRSERRSLANRAVRRIGALHDERALVEVLEGREHALTAHALRGVGAARSLSARTILGFLRLSPLLEVLPDGRCCLIGAAAGDSGR